MRGPSHPCLSPISSQTTWGPHAPCGGKAPDLQGPGLTWASCLLTGWGHLSGTPVHRAASSSMIKKPWMSNLDATWSPRVLESRQSAWVLGDAGCFTKVGCVPNPRATPFIPRTEVHYSTQDNSSSAPDTETAFQISFVQTQMTPYRFWKLDPE